MYRLDATLRHADALQQTMDTPKPAAGLNQATLERLGLAAGAQVTVRQGQIEVSLPLVLDARLPDNQAFIPAGFAETSALNANEAVSLEAA